MAEERKSAKEKLMTVLKIILGLVLVGAGVWAIVCWRCDVLALIRGSIGIIIVLAGIICFAIAKE